MRSKQPVGVKAPPPQGEWFRHTWATASLSLIHAVCVIVPVKRMICNGCLYQKTKSLKTALQCQVWTNHFHLKILLPCLFILKCRPHPCGRSVFSNSLNVTLRNFVLSPKKTNEWQRICHYACSESTGNARRNAISLSLSPTHTRAMHSVPFKFTSASKLIH